MAKIIEFKTVSPMFEMERDGVKMFTVRLIDPKDKRFKALNQWRPEYQWAISTTNPATGEMFKRRIQAVSFLWYYKQDVGIVANYKWRIIILGELVD